MESAKGRMATPPLLRRDLRPAKVLIPGPPRFTQRVASSEHEGASKKAEYGKRDPQRRRRSLIERVMARQYRKRTNCQAPAFLGDFGFAAPAL